MLTENGLRVCATQHATERALKRNALSSRGRASAWVERTALDALAAGRRAKRLPRWCQVGDYRARLTGEGTYRFLWDEKESAVLLARRTRGLTDQGPVWLVLTVMVPRSKPAYPATAEV